MQKYGELNLRLEKMRMRETETVSFVHPTFCISIFLTEIGTVFWGSEIQIWLRNREDLSPLLLQSLTGPPTPTVFMGQKWLAFTSLRSFLPHAKCRGRVSNRDQDCSGGKELKPPYFTPQDPSLGVVWGTLLAISAFIQGKLSLSCVVLGPKDHFLTPTLKLLPIFGKSQHMELVTG